MDLRQLAKDVGADFFNKLSDPPIPCYTFTEKQLEKFAKLIRNPTEQEYIEFFHQRLDEARNHETKT